MTTITPTVGRIVLYHPFEDVSQTWAAIVTRVWNDRMVNLSAFTPEGLPVSRTSVALLQEGDLAYMGSGYCEWMPYQKGQAAKYEALKAEIGKGDA